MRRSIQHSVLSIQRAGRLFIAALREIFDESAYSRFLHRTGLGPSPASFTAFQQEHSNAKARRPKCC